MKRTLRRPVSAVCALAAGLLLPLVLRAETVQYQIAATGDDTHCSVGSNYVTNGDMNFPYNSDAERRPFLRWSLGIPAGATIESAYLKVLSRGAGDANVTTIRLWALDYDSCPSFALPANPFDWPMRAGVSVDWPLPGTFTSGQWYTSPDIKTPVQAFINRPGYAPGKYLGLRGQWISGRYKWISQGGGGSTDGAILEVTYSGGNFAPAANAGSDQVVVDSDYSGSEPVTLEGSLSGDSDGTITSYVWSEGGTQIATGVNPQVPLGPGVHTITLTVTDDDGATGQDTVVVTVHSIYYVDFEGGSDANSGLSTGVAWKHCPGDTAATGVSAGTALVGGVKIIFKGGATYRGTISCNWSGSAGLPITYDGNTAGTFGTARAVFDGSETLGGWTQCTSSAEAGGNPNWANLWYAYAPAGTNANTSNLYQFKEADDIEHMCWMAQTPNQTEPFFMDNSSNFFTVPCVKVTTTSVTDSNVLTQADANYWNGAFVMVWVQPSMVNARAITSFDPATDTITFSAVGSPYTDRDEKYAIYNHLSLIDRAGEYYFNDTAEADGRHKVWLWPPAGDPNDNPVSVSVPASRHSAFRLTANRSYLTFTGLRMQKYSGGGSYGGLYGGSGINFGGVSGLSHITVTDCEFAYLRHDYRDGNGYGALTLGGSNHLVEGNSFVDLPVTNAMQFGGSDTIFRNNYIERPGRHGLWMTFTNCQIIGNVMTDVRGMHADGIAVFNGSSNVLVAGNVILNSGVPICTQSSSNVTVAYNHLHCPGFYAYANYNGCTNLKIHNNTLRTGSYYYSLRNDSGGETRNNIYYSRTGSLTPDAGGNLVLDDNHSMDAAVFANPAAGDYRLKAGGPAVDAGLSLGYSEDVEGNPVPMGAGSDIGAYEYRLGGQSITAWMSQESGGPGPTLADNYIESRPGGLRTIRVTFTSPLEANTVSAAVVSLVGQTGGNLSHLVQSASLVGGNVLEIALSTLPDGDWYTVRISDRVRTTANYPVSGDLDFRLGVLWGDVDSSGAVTAADIVAVRGQAALALTTTNLRYDLDGSGQINGTDMLAVRGRLGRQLP